MNRCECGRTATRLVRVVETDPGPDGERRTVFSMDRFTRIASCEPHRRRIVAILTEQWEEEIAAGKVEVFAGKGRR